ncbi:MAG: 3-hydroxyacyl-ACP dehydratase FabZ family protein [Thermodesulfovibrionales bacterium]|jgi:3-hydroxyacyl-[acyl-carrier-protein] dehydratase
MRYLLIDRIIEWQLGDRMKGIKNVAMSEDFLEFHFPKKPIMPGVLLLEAFAQLAGWLEAASSDFENWFLITKIYSCKFYGFAFPGDQVELEVQLNPESTSERKKYAAIARVEGKKKIAVDFEGELISLRDIEDVAEQRRFFQVLTRE